MPHVKVDKSVYIVPIENLNKVKNYLDDWGDKVKYKIFKVLLNPDKFKKMDEKSFEDEWTEIPVQ